MRPWRPRTAAHPPTCAAGFRVQAVRKPLLRGVHRCAPVAIGGTSARARAPWVKARVIGTPSGARCPPRCDEHPFPRLGGGVRHPWVPPASWAHRVKAGTSRPPQHYTRTDLCRGRPRCVRCFPLYPFVCGVVEAFLNFHRVCSIQSESFSLVIQRTMLVLQPKLGNLLAEAKVS